MRSRLRRRRSSALLLERHGIPFEELAAGRAVEAEACTLLRVEQEFDDVHSRYEGRQIVTQGRARDGRASSRQPVGPARG